MRLEERLGRHSQVQDPVRRAWFRSYPLKLEKEGQILVLAVSGLHSIITAASRLSNRSIVNVQVALISNRECNLKWAINDYLIDYN
jgi:hypothetical protein